MNILILGSGGREHAIAKKIKSDDTKNLVYIIPGNAGIENDGFTCEDIDIFNFSKIWEYINQKSIDLTIIGPEILLEAGIVDFLEKKGHFVIGPSKEAARIETSKSYAKKFMRQAGIPTASFEIFNQERQAIEYLNKEFNKDKGIVIKTSSLAAGKGVVVTHEQKDAADAIRLFLNKDEPLYHNEEILIEERLDGEELSVFTYIHDEGHTCIGYARDYKRLFEQNKGPNTGGMGAISHNELLSKDLEKKIESEVILPFIKHSDKIGLNYRGFLFLGLMIKNDTINVIEFNSRLGDPETQVILPRLKNKLIDILLLKDRNSIFYNDVYIHTVMTSKNYACLKGVPLDLNHTIPFDNALMKEFKDCEIYFSGVKKNDKCQLINSSGRVLGVTTKAKSYNDAKKSNHQLLHKLEFKNAYWRKDIGQ